MDHGVLAMERDHDDLWLCLQDGSLLATKLYLDGPQALCHSPPSVVGRVEVGGGSGNLYGVPVHFRCPMLEQVW